MPDTTTIGTRRELAHRVSGGVEITLYWSPPSNSTSIEVWQRDSEELLLAFPVARERALDAFYHPFAHLLQTTSDVVVTALGT
jgi:hypothetical protein